MPESKLFDVLCYPRNLNRHLSTGQHFYGASNVSHTSKFKKVRQSGKTWTPSLQRSSPETIQDTVIKCVKTIEEGLKAEKVRSDEEQEHSRVKVNTKHFCRGFAKKTTAKKGKRNIKQLRFLEFWIGRGEHGNKVSPEIAEKIMRVVGTKEGEELFPNEPYMKSRDDRPIFNLLELLSVSQLKSYTSKKANKIKEQREKLEIRIRKTLGNIIKNIEDEFEEIDEE